MEQLLDNVEREEMELLAFQVTDIFVNTPGAPNNWEEGADASNNIMSLGITTKDRELSPSKVQRMFALNYTELKKTLNLERYNLYLTLRHSNRTIINQTGFIPTNISTQQVSVRRLVMDGAEPREVGLILWK
ncbi:hypothetical protein J4444_00605 [Candidatus Woesearchaeota archaeon]|nr:hypothetical protein [Candidatus Woesearchaeota archaeon]